MATASSTYDQSMILVTRRFVREQAESAIADLDQDRRQAVTRAVKAYARARLEDNAQRRTGCWFRWFGGPEPLSIREALKEAYEIRDGRLCLDVLHDHWFLFRDIRDASDLYHRQRQVCRGLLRIASQSDADDLMWLTAADARMLQLPLPEGTP